MAYRQLLCAVLGSAALLSLSACAYDPYYRPLAANPYNAGPYYAAPQYDYVGPQYIGPPATVYIGPGRGRYYDHHWRGGWHSRYGYID